jgi:hypothetical protein
MGVRRETDRSGSYGAAYGIVADIPTVSERGSYVGSLIFLYVTLVWVHTFREADTRR